MRIINRISRMSWITSVLTPLAIILMEVLWVYSWLVWFGQWPASGTDHPPLSLVSLVFLFGASFLATWYFLKREWSIRRIRLSIVACGVIAIFMVVRFEYNAGYELFDGQWFVYIGRKILSGLPALGSITLALVLGIGLWWRGIKWGGSRLYLHDIYRSFLFGMFALALLVIVWGVSLGTDSLSNLTSSTGVYVAGFFFFGLSALALGNLHAIQERMTAKEGTGSVLNYRWLSIMLGVIGAIILVGVVLATVFSEDVVEVLKQVINTVGDWLSQGLYYIFYAFGYITYVFQFFLRIIFSLIGQGEPIDPTEFDFGEAGEQAEQAVPKGLPPAAILAIKWTIFAIIAGLLLFLLARAVRRFMLFRDIKDIEQTDESLWSWAGFKADLRLLFSMLGKRFKRVKKVPVTVRQYTEETEGILNIREIYQRLLRETSQLRIARQHSETPYEYAMRFSRSVPEGSEYLNELTDVYVNVRYSELDAGEKQTESANSIWRVLKSLLRKLQSLRHV